MCRSSQSSDTFQIVMTQESDRAEDTAIGGDTPLNVEAELDDVAKLLSIMRTGMNNFEHPSARPNQCIEPHSVPLQTRYHRTARAEDCLRLAVEQGEQMADGGGMVVGLRGFTREP